MTLVYLDSAGPGIGKGCLVAAGVVISGQHIWTRAAAEIHALKVRVPPALRKGFQFRADLLLRSPRYEPHWPVAQRMELLEHLMQLPRTLGAPIVWAVEPGNQSAPADINAQASAVQKAVATCLGCVELLLETEAPELRGEKILAHTRANIRNLMRHDLEGLASRPDLIGLDVHTLLASDPVKSRLQQAGLPALLQGMGRRVQFVDRTPAWMLQIADALAYGLCRMRDAATKAEATRYAQLIFGSDAQSLLDWSGSPRGHAGITCWEAPSRRAA